jgi:DNA-binding NarL/FixJ family response regulator
MSKAEQSTKVLCVDDSPDIGGLCRRLIDSEADMQCVGVLHTADGLVDHVEQVRPDVVLLDLTMPGKDPVDAIRELAISAPWCRVLAFSGHDDDERLLSITEAGAWGLVSKGADPTQLTAAIRRVATGDFVRPN